MNKLIKFLLAISVIALSFSNVFAYKNGDRITDIGAEIPSDGTTIRIFLPQGDYPSGSKALLYAQTNVFCPVPGMELEVPSPDKNPYKLAAEYKFTDSDIATLKNGNHEVVTTLKFDPECGGLEVLIQGSEESAPSTIVDANRPSGGEESSTGVKLTVYSSGTIVEAAYQYNAGVLTFQLPQGSYTLGDYVVISKDNVVLTSLTIYENIMNELAEGNYTSKVSIDGITKDDELKFFISDVPFEADENVNGDDLVEVDPTPGTDTPGVDEPTEASPLLVGMGVFVAVLAIGFGYMYFEEQKKKAKKAGK